MISLFMRNGACLYENSARVIDTGPRTPITRCTPELPVTNTVSGLGMRAFDQLRSGKEAATKNSRSRSCGRGTFEERLQTG